MAYPVSVDVDYAGGERNQGLAVAGILLFVKVLLLIPHLILLVILYIAAVVVAYVGFWVVAITGKMPDSMFGFLGSVISWFVRAEAWLFGLTDEYPPFAFDAPHHPAKFTAAYGDGTRNRGLAASGIIPVIKALLALPHFVIVGILTNVASIGAYIGFFLVAFTGKLPEGLHALILGVVRWNARAYSWLAGLEDEYPPFGLE